MSPMITQHKYKGGNTFTFIWGQITVQIHIKGFWILQAGVFSISKALDVCLHGHPIMTLTVTLQHAAATDRQTYVCTAAFDDDLYTARRERARLLCYCLFVFQSRDGQIQAKISNTFHNGDEFVLVYNVH